MGPPNPPTETSIAFDVLLSAFPVHVRGRGLSLEMVCEWGQMRPVLEAGTVNEATLEEVFGECCVATPLGPRATKDAFGMVRPTGHFNSYKDQLIIATATGNITTEVECTMRRGTGNARRHLVLTSPSRC